MSDIVIGKARVIAVEEIVLKQPAILIPGSTTPEQTKTVIASKLTIEPIGETDGFTAIHGTLTIPGQLPFGMSFDLVLRERNGSLVQENTRKFQES